MRCSVLNCVNSARDSDKTNSSVSYHKFPRENSLKLEWMMRCNREGKKWNPDASYICSLHFKSEDYNDEEPGGSNQESCLKSWAVPSCELPQLTLPVCLLQRIDSEDLKEITMKNQMKVGDLTVEELKTELKKRKLAHVGPKVALVKRLRKAIADSGDDPDNFSMNDEADNEPEKEAVENSKADVASTDNKNPSENDTDKSSTSVKTDTKKTPAPKSETEEPKKDVKEPKKEEKESKKEEKESKKEEKEIKKLVDEVETPKRALRRSTREKSPAIQSTPTTPSKTPRAAKAKTAPVNKLTALSEEDELKDLKKDSASETKSEESKEKKLPAKKEVKKEVKKVEEVDQKKEPSKEKKDAVKKQSEKDNKDTGKEVKKDEEANQEKTKEETIVNGQKDADKVKSPEKKIEEKEPEAKKVAKKSVESEKASDKENEDKAEIPDKEISKEEKEEAEAKQAELDLDLDDMEQPDYEEELNFDCGSTFISDNDADLDETQDDGKSKETPSKKQRRSNADTNKEGASATSNSGVSDKPEEGKDTEEDKEKSKTSDKNVTEKEETRDSEKGPDGKEDVKPKDLWVTGLSSATKAADLKQAFLKHGKVISTKIVMNPKMPGSQCFGIVTVVSQEDALACVKALNVTELLGRFITVKIIAKKKDKDKKDDGIKKKKDDETSKDKSDEKKEFLSPKKDLAKEGAKVLDDKEKRERDIRRDREGGGIRKRLGRVPIRRSPPPFVKRRQELRQQEMMRRREVEVRRRAMDRRMAEEAQRQESLRLNREREMLRMERERIEREKAELLRLERERIDREKEEIRKQHMRLEEVRRKREFGGPREDFDRSKRQMNERHYSDRRPSPNYGGQQPYRRDERPSGRFDNRDRYDGGGDRRNEGWRDDVRGGAWQGDKGNNDQWAQQQGGSHERHWNNSSNKGRGGYNSGSSRGGNGPPSGYNRGGQANNMGGPSSMNPYPPAQQHNFNPYPPPKY